MTLLFYHLVNFIAFKNRMEAFYFKVRLHELCINERPKSNLVLLIFSPALRLVHSATLLGLIALSSGAVLLQDSPADLHHLLQLDLVPPQVAFLLVLLGALLLLVGGVAGNEGLVAALRQ